MKITICGSMQFEPEMKQAAAHLHELGYEIATPNSVEGHAHGQGMSLDKIAHRKRGFIDEHFEKIDSSDAILVANFAKNGIANYIGGNTLMEMGHAYAQGLELFLLNDIPGVSYRDEIAGMHPIALDGQLENIPEYFASLPKVHISSESPVKHLAVSRAFRRVGVPVQTVAEAMPSGVAEQPSSIDETYEGALNRHELLVKKVGQKAGEWLVTLESGIFVPRREHNFFGCTAIVVEKDGERRVGIDTDLEFPKHMTSRVPSEFKDLGALVKAEHGATTSDPFPYFTGGKLTRAKVIENGIYNVLVQFEGQA